MVTKRDLLGAFKSNSNSSSEFKGGVGYDNPRENIDPHIKTKVVSSQEIVLNKFKLLSGASVNSLVLTADTTGNGTWRPSSGSGESNTASNLGDGAHIFKQKTGVDLEFKSLSGASSKVSVISGASQVIFDIVPSNINTLDLNNNASWISAAQVIGDNLGNHIATQNITGSNLIMTGNISGSFIYGDGSNLRNIPGASSFGNLSAAVLSWNTLSSCNVFSGATVDFKNLGGWNEIMFSIRDSVTSSAGIRRFQVSDDNFVSTISGAYLNTESSIGDYGLLSSSSNGARSATVIIHNWNLSSAALSLPPVHPCTGTLGGVNTVVSIADPNLGTTFNALRFTNSAGILNGGRAFVYGR